MSERAKRVAKKVLADKAVKANAQVYVDCWIAGCLGSPHRLRLRWSDIQALARAYAKDHESAGDA